MKIRIDYFQCVLGKARTLYSGMDEHAITKRFPAHIDHRTRIMKRCHKVFKIKLWLKVWGRMRQLFVKLNIVRKRVFQNENLQNT